MIEKLREQSKVPARARGRVRVGKCLVFIDEVHALAKSTATALLSAMDDARIATVGGVEYDFGDVVFVAATTDKGLLSDAFVSRMDIIPLAGPTRSLSLRASFVSMRANFLADLSFHAKCVLRLPREVAVTHAVPSAAWRMTF